MRTKPAAHVTSPPMVPSSQEKEAGPTPSGHSVPTVTAGSFYKLVEMGSTLAL